MPAAFVLMGLFGLFGFVFGFPLLIIGVAMSMATEKAGKAVDRYFERRMAARGHPLPKLPPRPKPWERS